MITKDQIKGLLEAYGSTLEDFEDYLGNLSECMRRRELAEANQEGNPTPGSEGPTEGPEA